ncbi:hypothetical protein M3Y94_00661500 [Aphelenchoides besseyi]|nr:hypothetical protein M3Y94_00661500 [Aphelenchoides besseyi]
MGLYALVSRDAEFELQFNCSFYAVDDIPLERRQHRAFAVFAGGLGIFFELLYIPVIYALSHRQVLAASFCYKLMLLMSLYDAVSLAITSLLPAYFSFFGLMYCSHPILMYAAGSILHGFWIGYSQISLILALNRCLSFSEYKWIFVGWRQSLWMGLPIGFTVFVVLFGSAGLYNSVWGGWFFDPHRSYYDDLVGKYTSDIQFYNNIVFISALPIIYVVFVFHHFSLSRQRSGGMPKKAMGLFIQTLVVNVTIALAALGYTLMQYFNLPVEAIAFSHVSWIIVEGTPTIVYLIFNQTIRQILFTDKKEVTSSTANYKRVSQNPTGGSTT